jgi:hypothetical protein
MRWELMDKYLAGECSATEHAEVERWLSEAPARRLLLEQLAGPGAGALSQTRAEIWARLLQEVGADTNPVSTNSEDRA